MACAQNTTQNAVGEPGSIHNLLLKLLRRLPSGAGDGFGSSAAAHSKGDFDAVASSGFRAVEGFIGCLNDFFRRCCFLPEVATPMLAVTRSSVALVLLTAAGSLGRPGHAPAHAGCGGRAPGPADGDQGRASAACWRRSRPAGLQDDPELRKSIPRKKYGDPAHRPRYACPPPDTRASLEATMRNTWSPVSWPSACSCNV